MTSVNNEIRESKVDDLPRMGKDLITNRTFSTMRMIRHRTFPSKDESTNVDRGHQTTKNAKKQTQRRRRRHLLCVDAFDAAYSPFFRRCHGNLEKRSRVKPNLTSSVCPGPKAFSSSLHRSHACIAPIMVDAIMTSLLIRSRFTHVSIPPDLLARL